MLWIVLGMIGILAGIVLMILSNLWLGLVVLLAGVGLMAFNYSTMMRGRGDNPDQGTYNGLSGQGKQQSEAVSANMPEQGEQIPEIWEKMEK